MKPVSSSTGTQALPLGAALSNFSKDQEQVPLTSSAPTHNIPPPLDDSCQQSWSRTSPALTLALVPRPPFPSALTDIQGAGVWPLGERHSFIKLFQHLLLGLGDGVAVQDLHRHTLRFSRPRPHRQQRI